MKANKSNLNELLPIINKIGMNEYIEYIIKNILDSNYLFKKFMDNFKKLKELRYNNLNNNPSKEEDELINIMNIILDISKFKIISNKKGKLIIEEIYMGKQFIKLGLEHYEKTKTIFYNSKNNSRLIKNYSKLNNFLKHFFDTIEKEYRHNYKLNFILIFNKENDDKELFNISCKYISYRPSTNSNNKKNIF